MFQLCWRQHGGSGASISYEAVLDMSVAERNWWLARTAQQRETEAMAMAQATKGR